MMKEKISYSSQEARIYTVTEEDEIEEQDPSSEDFKRLASDSITITRTLKDLNMSQDYLNNEANLPDIKSKCQKCLKINCRMCFRMEKMTPKETAVLEEMKENIEETTLPDKTLNYTVKYVTFRDLKYTFPPN